MRKQGLSELVTVIFIILISVSSVSVFWIGILPLIHDKIQMEQLCFEAERNIYLKNSCIDTTKSDIYHQIKKEIVASYYMPLASPDQPDWPFEQPQTYYESLDSECKQRAAIPPIPLGYNVTKIIETCVSVIPDSEVDYALGGGELTLETYENINSNIVVNIELSVNRKVSDFELVDLQIGGYGPDYQSETLFLIQDKVEGPSSQTYSLSDLPKSNEQKAYYINFGALASLQLTEAFVAPVIGYEGKTNLCHDTPTDKIELCSGVIDEFS